MIMWFLFFTSKKYRQTRTPPPPKKKKPVAFVFFACRLLSLSPYGVSRLLGLSHYGLSLGWFVAYYGVYRFGRIMTKSDQLYIYIYCLDQLFVVAKTFV